MGWGPGVRQSPPIWLQQWGQAQLVSLQESRRFCVELLIGCPPCTPALSGHPLSVSCSDLSAQMESSTGEGVPWLLLRFKWRGLLIFVHSFTNGQLTQNGASGPMGLRLEQTALQKYGRFSRQAASMSSSFSDPYFKTQKMSVFLQLFRVMFSVFACLSPSCPQSRG